MAVYINQIKKRRQLDQTRLAEAIERGAQRMGFRRKKRMVPQDNESALRQVLDALGVTDYELEDNLLTPEEHLTNILRPRGIMMRRIKLTANYCFASVFEASGASACMLTNPLSLLSKPSSPGTKKVLFSRELLVFGGPDETRTRDPMRDRHVF